MTTKPSEPAAPPEIAAILDAMAVLMADLHFADLQLQDALSALAVRAKSVPEVSCLQHVDLVTQTHGDLARLLANMATALTSGNIDTDALKSELTLRSLQETLFNGADPDETDVPPGEMSLF